MITIVGLIVSIISALIAAISAWVAWRVAHPEPKLKMKVTTVFVSRESTVNYGSQKTQVETVLLPHIQLTNLSIHPVQLINYELEVTTNHSRRARMAKSRSPNVQLPFRIDERRIIAHFTKNNLMNWPPKAVSYGELTMGFLLFTDRGVLGDNEIISYELILHDVFGRSYRTVITNQECETWQSSQAQQSMNLLTLFEYAGATTTETPEE